MTASTLAGSAGSERGGASRWRMTRNRRAVARSRVRGVGGFTAPMVRDRAPIAVPVLWFGSAR